MRDLKSDLSWLCSDGVRDLELGDAKQRKEITSEGEWWCQSSSSTVELNDFSSCHGNAFLQQLRIGCDFGPNLDQQQLDFTCKSRINRKFPQKLVDLDEIWAKSVRAKNWEMREFSFVFCYTVKMIVKLWLVPKILLWF